MGNFVVALGDTERLQTVLIVTSSVKEDEREVQGHTSASLLQEFVMRHCAVNMHRCYRSAFSTLCFVLSVMDGKAEQHVFIKFCMKLSKSTTKTPEMNIQGDLAPAK
jgi:hypothetical protein